MSLETCALFTAFQFVCDPAEIFQFFSVRFLCVTPRLLLRLAARSFLLSHVAKLEWIAQFSERFSRCIDSCHGR